MALQLNWFKRYINHKYEDYLTLSIYRIFKVNPINRISILNYGSDYYSPLIAKWEHDIIKNIVQNLQNFLPEFVTNSDSGDNHFFCFSRPFTTLILG